MKIFGIILQQDKVDGSLEDDTLTPITGLKYITIVGFNRL